MEELILFLLQTYGVFGLSLAIAVFLFLKYSSYWVPKVTRIFGAFKTDNQFYRPSDVLLSKLVYWTEYKINNINITDPGRKKIFSDLLKNKFSTFKEKMFGIHELPNFDKFNSSELYDLLVHCLNSIIKDYEERTINDGVPEIVVKKFEQWHRKTTEYAFISLETICFSNIYSDNNMKMEAIYAMFIAISEITIAEAERSLTELNGELTGISYKGTVCK